MLSRLNLKRGISHVFLIFDLVVLSTMLAVSLNGEACVGARALGMGGAFIGVADDAEAVYWNPAGLALSHRREVTFTHTINNRDFYNYDEFLAVSLPGGSDGAHGFGLIQESYLIHPDLLQSGRRPRDKFEGGWLTYSYATAAARPLAVGSTFRYERYSLTLGERDPISGSRWAMDLGLLFHASPRLSLGILFQDLNGSPIRWEDGVLSWVPINVRPGLAYKFSNNDVVAIDIYDLTGETQGQRTLRAGYEKKFAPFALRFGYYGLGVGRGAPTLGIGYERGPYRIDYAYLGYGLIPGDPGLGGTHQLGVGVRF